MAVGKGIATDLRPVGGVSLAVGSAGIKTAGKTDLALIELAAGSQAAAVFTRNKFCAAPVHIARDHLGTAVASPRMLLINTGNANAGTGQQGHADALACCQTLAKAAGVPVEAVLPFSTGVIGEYLPMARIELALPDLAAQRGQADWYQVANAILTTDTRPKGHSVVVHLGDQEITVTGISKGSGMICPNMATMLAFVCTDAKLDAKDLQTLLQDTNDQSFNRITVDGDTSTNDACVLAATGASGVHLQPGTKDWSRFRAAVQEVMLELALQVVRDGEGATKVVALSVHHAATSQEALDVAYTIAHSPLFKTALSASDANWGRILAAIGRAPIEDLILDKVSIHLEDVPLVAGGERHPKYREEQGAAIFAQERFTIHIDLDRGDATETVWTTDLSHEYVSINADYRT
ncbi:MAG: bifunctional glutamate N-acetyltransferase/amino-acid acetyltransferase ArgJ [Natronospirillum sp.]|uniref:bifunctional glutamate N-acetyltransferase/amino-acid acetyltransferase ArgJ n=1 Tax=Natronospirillum sp. TaxID=2812955 RepID=UPI0025F3C74A|nr:bifunctional glutamate N-acetyltransferase/amino-acid acetyltransferase ArgJ [Natronospirillum sp.]MCH8551344.1 bifunctional glutamate N-acetyltransferase/amino-acid acetyltransferase ArgJ [Natronospirillum sp.]